MSWTRRYRELINAGFDDDAAIEKIRYERKNVQRNTKDESIISKNSVKQSETV